MNPPNPAGSGRERNDAGETVMNLYSMHAVSPVYMVTQDPRLFPTGTLETASVETVDNDRASLSQAANAIS